MVGRAREQRSSRLLPVRRRRHPECFFALEVMEKRPLCNLPPAQRSSAEVAANPFWRMSVAAAPEQTSGRTAFRLAFRQDGALSNIPNGWYVASREALSE